MKKLIGLLKRIGKTTARIVIVLTSIAVSFAIIFFFRYIGLKGGMGFIVGVFATGVFFMLDNPILIMFREKLIK